ncbi:hypothetical protein X801_06456 [Opisthorchis viverrini]|uniref:HOOK N-terminal domain-containing protein n=1 Tax=Opisthorchis viverrini TaxID=6198 RepID=A0A1S8WU00_OPIVI|nr:hypothetical protein X801_06456 [Opisthorchis viverrini]
MLDGLTSGLYRRQLQINLGNLTCSYPCFFIFNGLLDCCLIAELLSIQRIPFVFATSFLLAEYNAEDEAFRLLQLVLGCAVNCENKSTYIEAIMHLEESVQHVLMEAIQQHCKEEENFLLKRQGDFQWDLKDLARGTSHNYQTLGILFIHEAYIDYQCQFVKQNYKQLVQT